MEQLTEKVYLNKTVTGCLNLIGIRVVTELLLQNFQLINIVACVLKFTMASGSQHKVV